jgi:maltose alpha-D-glucosyltransferase/alpha-amylase
MRKEVPEVGWGDFVTIASGDRSVLIMRYDWRDNSVLFVHNLDARPREVAFSVGLDEADAEQCKLLINLLSEDHSHADDSGSHRIIIEPYGYRWYRVGGLDYLLRRTEVDQRLSRRFRKQPARSDETGACGEIGTSTRRTHHRALQPRSRGR